VILQSNPDGVLAHADEIVGLLSRLDGEEHRSERAFYLEAFNGKNSFTVDRITRSRVHIPQLCLSIVGSTQPDAIRRYLQQAVHGGIANDGLVQRFQLAVYPDRKTGGIKIVDRLPDAAARERAAQVFRNLKALTGANAGAQLVNDTWLLGFDDIAQPEVFNWLTEIQTILTHWQAHDALISHVSKFQKTIPALALVIHLAEGRTGPIDLTAFEKATAWMLYLRSHAKRIYSCVTTSHFDSARELGNRIGKGKLQDGFTQRDVTRNGWGLLGSSDIAGAALDVLVEYGWIYPVEDKKAGGGRTTTRYFINPSKKAGTS
jgi:hypothetical protein